MIQIKALNKSYGEKSVLSSLSFSIKANERVALIGSSGSGKSTLLNLIAKNIEADSGEIMVDGKPLSSYASHRTYAKTVGMIQQSLDMVPQLTVLQNVLAGHLGRWSNFEALKSLYKPKAKPEALSVLKRLGIEPLAETLTHQLSGGEKQRVAVARLLVQNPKLILADEPVASLDPARAKEVVALLCDLCLAEQKTLVMSLHTVSLALEHFDRVIGIRDGQVYLDCLTEEVDENALAMLYAIEESTDET